MNNTLIEKLTAAKIHYQWGNYISLETAIAIVREHFAAPDVVDRVADAVRPLLVTEQGDWHLSKADQIAKAAIAAMGGSSVVHHDLCDRDSSGRSVLEESPASAMSEISDVEVNNLLHLMNLDRPDIAALPQGATIAINVTTHRQAADLIKRLASNLQKAAGSKP